jgi:hypothetical protein
MLGALLAGPLNEAIDDARDPTDAFETFFEDVQERLVVPRLLKDRIRAITIAQRRLRANKLGSLPRRDFFRDAATLYAIECEAGGERVPEWAEDPDSVEGPPQRRGRRRRRRGG